MYLPWKAETRKNRVTEGEPARDSPFHRGGKNFAYAPGAATMSRTEGEYPVFMFNALSAAA